MLFGTSGIRAIVNKRLTSNLAMNISMALATYLHEGNIILGRDTRTSGRMIESAMVSGFLSSGINVYSAGIIPTPTLAFLTKYLKMEAGVMVTASHNPPEYNGVKLWDQKGMAYTPIMEREIEEIINQANFKRVQWDKIGKEFRVDQTHKYIETILNSVDIEKKFEIVVDCANGSGSKITPYVIRSVGSSVVTLNCQKDGFFPGRAPEPTEKNLFQLIKMVKILNSNLGLAHDGDADRVVAVDDKGRFVPFDKLLAIYAMNEGKKIVTTVDASMLLDEVCDTIIRTKVGDVAVADGILKNRADFGGEPSGSFIFPSIHLAPDGILAALKLIEIIQKEKLSSLVDSLPNFVTIREKFSCKEKDKKNIMDRVFEESKYEDILTIDGLRVNFGDSWFLIRPSGTEPYIRITCEAKDEKKAKQRLEEGKTLLMKAMKTLK